MYNTLLFAVVILVCGFCWYAIATTEPLTKEEVIAYYQHKTIEDCAGQRYERPCTEYYQELIADVR